LDKRVTRSETERSIGMAAKQETINDKLQKSGICLRKYKGNGKGQ
jgi:hypothetical protein